MSLVAKNKLLQVTEEEAEKVRKQYKVTKESLDADIDVIVEWFRMQPHLPKMAIDRRILEKVYLSQKCSTQRTKNIIDMRFTSKTIAPELLLNRDTRASEFASAMKNTCYLPLPKLTPDLCRIHAIRHNTPNTETYDYTRMLQMVVMIYEILLKDDYALGEKVILDCLNVTPTHFLNINPFLLTKVDTILRKSIGSRIFGIYIINGGKMIEKLLLLMKQCMSQKIADRIYVLSATEELKEFIPVQYLPKDYGGELETIDTLWSGWQKYLTSDEIWEYFKEQDKYITDENKRPADSFTVDSIGVPGSFKNINID